MSDIRIESGGASGVAAEDSAAVSGQRGMPAFVQRKDTAGSLVGSDGDLGMLQMDASGNLRVTLAQLIAGEDLVNNKLTVEHSYTSATGTASGVIKASAAFVHTCAFSASSSAVVNLYNNASAASGTKLAILRVAAGTTSQLLLNNPASNGLYLELASGAGEYAISYR